MVLKLSPSDLFWNIPGLRGARRDSRCARTPRAGLPDDCTPRDGPQLCEWRHQPCRHRPLSRNGASPVPSAAAGRCHAQLGMSGAAPWGTVGTGEGLGRWTVCSLDCSPGREGEGTSSWRVVVGRDGRLMPR